MSPVAKRREVSGGLICRGCDGVSTGSGSDRVATDDRIDFARMLPGRYRSRYRLHYGKALMNATIEYKLKIKPSPIPVTRNVMSVMSL